MSATETNMGKRRLVSPRLSDMGQGPTPEQVEQRREQLRANAKYRPSKEASKAALKALAGKKTRKALGGAPTSEEASLVAQNALALATDAAREVAVSSPFVAHQTTRFGVNAALAGFYTQAAANAGFSTEQGMRLIELAHRCENQATKAMVACEAAVRAFAGKPRKQGGPSAAIDAEYQRYMAAQVAAVSGEP